MYTEPYFVTTIAMPYQFREKLDALRIKQGAATGKFPPLRKLLTAAIEAYLKQAAEQY